MKAKKIRGFMVLPAVLMSILLGLLGLSFLQIYSGQFSALSANKSALQAAQFAESESDYLRNLDYSKITSGAHARKAISGATGWQSQVTLGSETTVSGVKQRMATVTVYRNDSVTTPDFSLQVPLSSAGNSVDTFPVGTILPYIGSTANIPPKWALCNGSNGTPNLTGRFLEGVTNASAAKISKAAGLPNITGRSPHIFGRSGGGGFHVGLVGTSGGTGVFKIQHAFSSYCAGIADSDNPQGGGTPYLEFDASQSNPIFGKSSTVQPNSYTVMYIMKIQA